MNFIYLGDAFFKDSDKSDEMLRRLRRYIKKNEEEVDYVLISVHDKILEQSSFERFIQYLHELQICCSYGNGSFKLGNFEAEIEADALVVHQCRYVCGNGQFLILKQDGDLKIERIYLDLFYQNKETRGITMTKDEFKEFLENHIKDLLNSKKLS